MKKQPSSRKSAGNLNSGNARRKSRPRASHAKTSRNEVGSPAQLAGGAPEFVAGIQGELERWQRRFAEGEPMFVRGDILQPSQLSAQLLAGKGSLAGLLEDGYRVWLGDGGNPSSNEIEAALIGYFNEIIMGSDLFRNLCNRAGLDCEWRKAGLTLVPLTSTFDHPDAPDEPDPTNDETEQGRQVDAAVARAKQAWKEHGLASGEGEPSVLEYVLGFRLSGGTQKALEKKCAPELLPFRNRMLLNDSFPAEVSGDLIREVVPLVVVQVTAEQAAEVERIEAIGASGIAIHLKGGRAPVRYRKMMLMHYSRAVVHLDFMRAPAATPEMGFHTGLFKR